MTKLTAEKLEKYRAWANGDPFVRDLLDHITAVEAERDALIEVVKVFQIAEQKGTHASYAIAHSVGRNILEDMKP